MKSNIRSKPTCCKDRLKFSDFWELGTETLVLTAHRHSRRPPLKAPPHRHYSHANKPSQPPRTSPAHPSRSRHTFHHPVPLQSQLAPQTPPTRHTPALLPQALSPPALERSPPMLRVPARLGLRLRQPAGVRLRRPGPDRRVRQPSTLQLTAGGRGRTMARGVEGGGSTAGLQGAGPDQVGG